MDHNYPAAAKGPRESQADEAWLFAQVVLGESVSSLSRTDSDLPVERDRIAWLAEISPRHENRLRARLRDEAEPAAGLARLKWLAGISTRHESQLRRLLAAEAQMAEARARIERLLEGAGVQEAKWDPAKHPRRGTAPNPGWFARTGGGGSSGGAKRTSILDKIVGRNRAMAELSGGPTPATIRAGRLATDLESAARLPGDVARAAAAGLRTGGKAVVNASATAVKNVATLGLSPGQLELIGVTKEDRERGYDTAVTIGTASGELLIAVGTGGLATALAKGGTVARTAGGALLVYDTAGNAVGAVQGTYDAATNGVTARSGAQIAAGALGLTANVRAAKGATKPLSPSEPSEAPARFSKEPSRIAPSTGSFGGEFTRVKPSELRFSQTTAGGGGRGEALRESMADGWNGPAVDAIRTPEGLVVMDNTRAALAQELVLCQSREFG